VASPTPGITGQPIAIAVHGSGTCPFDISYGDGNTQDVNGSLPQETRHVYQQAGRYAIVVRAHPPCAGKFTEAVQVGSTAQAPARPRIAKVSAAPTPATRREPVTLTVDGTGTCAFTIDYGDGNSDSRTMSLPGSLRHVYSAPGLYTVVVAPADSLCAGGGRLDFEVRR
jgi:PKD repeat protein